MHHPLKTAVTIGLSALTTATVIGGAANAATPSTTTMINRPTVYQSKQVNQNLLLGPQWAPSTLTKTAPLPAGTYLITGIVGAVISSHDQIVCSTQVSGNDGVFGTAGNPGTGGIYGTATMTDTLTVTTGQVLSLVCNSFNYGLGTYATTAVIEAVPVATVIKSS